jgi:hypothetical protein
MVARKLEIIRSFQRYADQITRALGRHNEAEPSIHVLAKK